MSEYITSKYKWMYVYVWGEQGLEIWQLKKLTQRDF